MRTTRFRRAVSVASGDSLTREYESLFLSQSLECHLFGVVSFASGDSFTLEYESFFLLQSLGCHIFWFVSFASGDRFAWEYGAFFLFSWVPYFWGHFLRKMKAFPSTSLGCRLVWRITGPRRFLFFLSSISLPTM